MKTEIELKNKCTPEIIKNMVELAEGFEFLRVSIYFNGIGVAHEWQIVDDPVYFPLLIRRAVEGWNKKEYSKSRIVISDDFLEYEKKFSGVKKVYHMVNYQPTTLTHAECAMLDCLIEVLK